MAETLAQQQRRFAQLIGLLISWSYAHGYELTFGDAYRDPRVHGDFGVKKSYSAARSQHKRRLAVDFNLFQDGQYMTSTESYRPLGLYWESIGGTWGGRFNDGNHFSLERDGYK